jgi:spore coat protein H
VPGTYQAVSGGLYAVIENVNKQFLKNVLPPGTGLLLKPEGLRGGVQYYGDSWSSYIGTYRPDRDATPREQQRVIEFARLVSQPDVAVFRSKIGSILDVENFLRYLAVNAFLGNWDSYINDDKIRFLPWDEDLSLGARANQTLEISRPLRNENPLIYWLLDDPAVAARYRSILAELSTSAFSREALFDVLTALEKATGRSAGTLRDFIESRVRAVEVVVKSGSA